jgi:hypothetical protein
MSERLDDVLEKLWVELDAPVRYALPAVGVGIADQLATDDMFLSAAALGMYSLYKGWKFSLDTAQKPQTSGSLIASYAGSLGGVSGYIFFDLPAPVLVAMAAFSLFPVIEIVTRDFDTMVHNITLFGHKIHAGTQRILRRNKQSSTPQTDGPTQTNYDKTSPHSPEIPSQEEPSASRPRSLCDDISMELATYEKARSHAVRSLTVEYHWETGMEIKEVYSRILDRTRIEEFRKLAKNESYGALLVDLLGQPEKVVREVYEDLVYSCIEQGDPIDFERLEEQTIQVISYRLQNDWLVPTSTKKAVLDDAIAGFWNSQATRAVKLRYGLEDGIQRKNNSIAKILQIHPSKVGRYLGVMRRILRNDVAVRLLRDGATDDDLRSYRSLCD